MNRYIPAMALALFLSACGRPTDLGQQYQDGEFEQILNPVNDVVSDKPHDYSLFPLQLQKIEQTSDTLTKTHQALYENIQQWLKKGGDPLLLADFGLTAAQMGGGDGFGNVLFTGYFSPVIELRRYPDEVYKYPLYKMPECKDSCPTRDEIYNGVLDGQGLELGYSASLIDVFIMEVQGSGFVHYGDPKEMQYFAYGGKNGHPYVSIGKVLIEEGKIHREKMSLKAITEWANQRDEETLKDLLIKNTSYVFFAPQTANDVKGTAGVPLVAGASVAADRAHLPMGSVLLAEIPQLNESGQWTGQHVLKLLIALDTGGAVKDNHLDLYHGMGKDAGIKAGHHKHFGRVWQLTAKAES